jgi:predicted nuclease of predicted toxin-antitoxin system
LRFVIDANLPRALSDWLRGSGHEVEHALDVALAQASDRLIWRHAAAIAAVIVSKDEDSADLARTDLTGPSVVWIRTSNGTNAQLIALLTPIWPRIEQRLAAGDRLIEVR